MRYCKNTEFTPYISCVDYLITGKEFLLEKCKECGLIQTNPRPSNNQLPEYYKSEDYISHSNKSKSIIEIIYSISDGYP